MVKEVRNKVQSGIMDWFEEENLKTPQKAFVPIVPDIVDKVLELSRPFFLVEGRRQLAEELFPIVYGPHDDCTLFRNGMKEALKKVKKETANAISNPTINEAKPREREAGVRMVAPTDKDPEKGDNGSGVGTSLPMRPNQRLADPRDKLINSMLNFISKQNTRECAKAYQYFSFRWFGISNVYIEKRLKQSPIISAKELSALVERNKEAALQQEGVVRSKTEEGDRGHSPKGNNQAPPLSPPEIAGTPSGKPLKYNAWGVAVGSYADLPAIAKPVIDLSNNLVAQVTKEADALGTLGKTIRDDFEKALPKCSECSGSLKVRENEDPDTYPYECVACGVEFDNADIAKMREEQNALPKHLRYTWICPKCKKDALKVSRLDGNHFLFHCPECGFDSDKLKFGGRTRNQSYTKAYHFLRGWMEAKKDDRELAVCALNQFADALDFEDYTGGMVALFG